MWISKSVPNLVVTIPENTVNSGDHNSGIPVFICALGDKNQHLPCFCLPTLTQNPLGVPGHIIHHWKEFSRGSQRRWNREKQFRIHREIMRTRMTSMDLRGITSSFLYRPPGSPRSVGWLPRTSM